MYRLVLWLNSISPSLQGSCKRKRSNIKEPSLGLSQIHLCVRLGEELSDDLCHVRTSGSEDHHECEWDHGHCNPESRSTSPLQQRIFWGDCKLWLMTRTWLFLLPFYLSDKSLSCNGQWSCLSPYDVTCAPWMLNLLLPRNICADVELSGGALHQE